MDATTNGPAAPPASPLDRPSGLGFFAVLLGLFAALGSAAQASSAALGLAWSELFALLLPAFIVAAGSNVQPARALLLARRPAAGVVPLGALIGGVSFVAAGSLMALESLLLPRRWLELFDVTRIFDRGPAEQVALGLGAAVLAPFCEEVAFRGWLLTALRARHRAGVAIVACGLLFALMHLDPVRFVALFALGSLYGWLAFRSGSIWPSAAAHAVNNGLGVLIASRGAPESSLAAAPAAAGQIAVTSSVVLLGAAGLLALLANAYRQRTPAPPPVSELVVRRDPAQAGGRFDAGRVPGLLVGLAVLGGALLVPLLVLGHAARR